MRCLAGILLLSTICLSGGRLLSAGSESAQAGAGTVRLSSDAKVYDLTDYYGGGYWHWNRFALLYVYSRDMAEARTSLDFYIRYIDDQAKLPNAPIDYHLLLCQAYARLAWMAKLDGDEAEFKRLAGQSVTNLRLLVDKSGRAYADVEAEETNEKASPPSDKEIYDALHMVLLLDRNSEVQWVKQSDYDFDGFLKTLQPE